MVISWNTGLAAERARYNLKLKNKKRPAAQAASGPAISDNMTRQAANSKLDNGEGTI